MASPNSPLIPAPVKNPIDWRKLIAMGVAGAVLPTVGAWAQNCTVATTCQPFTAGNVIGPALPTLLSTATALIAFFLNPRKAQ